MVVLGILCPRKTLCNISYRQNVNLKGLYLNLSNEFSFLFLFQMADWTFAIEFTDSYKHNRYLFVWGEHLIKVTFSIIKQHRNIDSHRIERILKLNFMEYFRFYVADKKPIRIPAFNFLRLTDVYVCLFTKVQVLLGERKTHYFSISFDEWKMTCDMMTILFRYSFYV